MARIKHGVFSWEDVLVQRYQSKFSRNLQYSTQKLNSIITRQATNPLPFHVAAALFQHGNHSPIAIYYAVYLPSFAL
jgi:hypothetical protein